MINLPDKCMLCGADCIGGSDHPSDPSKLYKCGAKIWVKDVKKWDQYILVFSGCNNEIVKRKDGYCCVLIPLHEWDKLLEKIIKVIEETK